MEHETAKHWICARTEPHRESFAETQLTQAGLDVYCPRYARWISSGRKKTLVKRPLFASYIFVRTGESPEKLWQIKRTPGIASLAAGTLSSAIVDDAIIAEIRSREKDGVIMLGGDRFQAGETVRISGGPLQGVEAIFEAQNDAERCRVLLSLLGSMQSVLILAEFLEKT